MPLSRLCFILPTDSKSSLQNPCKHRHRRIIRAALHRFFSPSRWHVRCTCRCFSCCFTSIHHQDSSRFEDIPGISEFSPNKKLTAGTANPRIFSYAELYIGSNGFSPAEVLGSGGFGRVYRAVLPSDGTVVAVKRVSDNRGLQLEKTFAAELVAVAQLRHRNLVRLRGWCVHDDQLLLVYDYMPNLSLDRLLFGPSSTTLGWEQRRKIVSGLSAALFYLHEQLDTQIIHRDVKTSNVMLDSGYNAKLGDFGLARWLEHNQLEMPMKASPKSVNDSSNNYEFRLTETSRIGGTIGYLPPESFQKRGSATVKSDVFSFGIVVLEIVTGRRAVDLSYTDDRIIMLDWVRRTYDESKFLDVGDIRLKDGSYSLSEMSRLIHLGLLCTLNSPQSRPTMKWVMEALSHGASKLPNLPSFQFHPMYMSLSSSSNTTTSTANTTTTTTSTTSDINSNFVSAAGTTIFLTADTDSGRPISSNNSSRSSFKPSFRHVDTPREITFKEIIDITNNFSESRMVAEMDFGTGYQGYLENRIHVLVKRLGMKTCPALRMRFSNELKNLARLRHRYLVQLRGWCTEQGEMLVVYDYSANSLLSHHLFHHKHSVLSWRHRYHIIKSLASAILYLHEEWEEQVIHRNITSSAIFLDPDMNPKLGSFALAEFLSRNEHGHHVASLKSSGARGIFGYMSPEYMESGEATTMADVYSFGVVVLEVVSGQMAVDFRWNNVLLAKKVGEFDAINRPLEEFADTKLDGRFDSEEMKRMVKLGMVCTSSDSKARPSMRQIVSILDGNDEFLNMLGHKKEGKEEWEEKNAASLSLIGRIKALGIQ